MLLAKQGLVSWYPVIRTGKWIAQSYDENKNNNFWKQKLNVQKLTDMSVLKSTIFKATRLTSKPNPQIRPFRPELVFFLGSFSHFLVIPRSLKGNKVLKTRKNGSFGRGVNLFRNAKVSLLGDFYCLTILFVKITFIF